MELPDFLIRYYPKAEEPLLTLNMLEPKDAERTKKLHCKKHGIGDLYGDDSYVPIRMEIEKWIYNEFIKKGGKPKMKAPIYFNLGKMAENEHHMSNMFKGETYEMIVNIIELDINAVSFVVLDSMYDFDYDTEKNELVFLGRTNTPSVYTFDELVNVRKKYHLYESPHYYTFEAQVWSIDMFKNAHIIKRKYTK